MKLSYRIALIIGPLSLVTLAVAVIFCYSTVSQVVQTQIMAQQRESVVENMDKIDRFLYERQSELIDTAEGKQFRDYIQGAPGISPEDVLGEESNDGDWNDFAIINLAGHTLLASDAGDEGTTFLRLNPAFPELFKKSLAGSGQLVHSDVLRLSDDVDPTIVMFTPIYDLARHPIGVLAGEVSWSSIIEIMKGIGADDITLTNQDGLEIGTNQDDNKSEVLMSQWKDTPLFAKAKAVKQGSAITSGLDNSKETVLASYVTESGYHDYKGNGWHLLATTSRDKAFAPVQAIALQLAGLLGGLLLLNLALIAYVMVRQVSRPLRKLSIAAGKISEGGWSQHIAVSSRDEIGELAAAFNAMSSQISISHQQMSQEKARLESSIQNLPLGFMLTDKLNNIVNINPQMRKLLGLKIAMTSSEALKGAKDLALLQDLLVRSQVCLESRKPVKVSEALINNHYYRFFLAPVMAGKDAIGSVVLLEDITEAKVAERSKDEFFSIASHELRTPLTAIRGNTSMIEQFYPEQLKDPGLHDMVGDIHASSLRLIEIVNDFLDTTRLEQGKMKFKYEAFAVEPVIDHVVYELDAVSHEQHIYLRAAGGTDPLPLVYADKDRVKQIIYNLVGNAMKFVKEGGVTISAAVDGQKLKVLVSDTGQGMTPENQQLLFHKFQQATTSTLTRDGTRGTGLGLYISKLLIEKMGGNITLEHSEVGKGSTFSFTIPLDGPAARKSRPTKS